MAKVKGMFFTLGLTLLATVLFSLAILIVNNAEVSKEAATDFVIADRLYELDSSIQNSLAEIFKSKSGISISGTTFQESLPNANYSNFSDTMFNYKNYTESTYNNIELNISRITEELPIYIPRYNVVYYHDFNLNKIIVNHTNSNIQGYRIEIDGMTGCNIDSYTSGFMTLNIPNSNCFNGLVSSAVITIYPYGMTISLSQNDLQMTNSQVAIVETEILVPDDQVAMYYPGDIVNIDFLEFGVRKSGSVRIM